MANSLRAKLKKLKHDNKIDETDYKELLKKLDGHDKVVREKALDEFAELLKDMTPLSENMIGIMATTLKESK